MLAALGPEPVAEPEEVFLVDLVQHRHHGPLDNLVFESGNGQRALLAVGLRDVDPSGRLRPIRSAMDTPVQIDEPWLEIGLIVRPRHAIHARRRVPLEGEERQPEQIHIDVVQQRGELRLLVQPHGFPYALERL